MDEDTVRNTLHRVVRVVPARGINPEPEPSVLRHAHGLGNKVAERMRVRPQDSDVRRVRKENNGDAAKRSPQAPSIDDTPERSKGPLLLKQGREAWHEPGNDSRKPEEAVESASEELPPETANPTRITETRHEPGV